MAPATSIMSVLGTEAPDFVLYDTENNPVKRDYFRGTKALLVVFLSDYNSGEFAIMT